MKVAESGSSSLEAVVFLAVVDRSEGHSPATVCRRVYQRDGLALLTAVLLVESILALQMAVCQ